MRRDILKEQKAAVADMGTSVYGLKNEIEELNLLSQLGKIFPSEYLLIFVSIFSFICWWCFILLFSFNNFEFLVASTLFLFNYIHISMFDFFGLAWCCLILFISIFFFVSKNESVIVRNIFFVLFLWNFFLNLININININIYIRQWIV